MEADYVLSGEIPLGARVTLTVRKSPSGEFAYHAGVTIARAEDGGTLVMLDREGGHTNTCGVKEATKHGRFYWWISDDGMDWEFEYGTSTP